MNYWQTDLIRLRGVEPEDGDIFWHWNQESEMARNLEFVWPPISIAQVRQEAAADAQKKNGRTIPSIGSSRIPMVRQSASFTRTTVNPATAFSSTDWVSMPRTDAKAMQWPQFSSYFATTFRSCATRR